MNGEANTGGAVKSSRSGSDRGDKTLGSRKWSPVGGCTRAAVVSNGYRVTMGKDWSYSSRRCPAVFLCSYLSSGTIASLCQEAWRYGTRNGCTLVSEGEWFAQVL